MNKGENYNFLLVPTLHLLTVHVLLIFKSEYTVGFLPSHTTFIRIASLSYTYSKLLNILLLVIF